MRKKAIKEWLNAFPQLSTFNQNKLYKVVGPCLIGLELIKSPFTEAYSPYFVMYPLWKKDVKNCLSYPILLKEFKNEKGFQYDIPYENDTMLFEAIKAVKSHSLLSSDGNISLKTILSTIDEYSKIPPLSAAPNSYMQAVLQEAKLKLAIFINAREAKSMLEQINTRSWDIGHFKACGVDVWQWLESLRTVLEYPEIFIKQVEDNKKASKISRLKFFDITDEP